VVTDTALDFSTFSASRGHDIELTRFTCVALPRTCMIFHGMTLRPVSVRHIPVMRTYLRSLHAYNE
jgi:hypothetical protein